MRCIDELKILSNLPKDVFSDEERQAVYNYAKSNAKNPKFDQFVSDTQDKIQRRINQNYRRNLLSIEKTKQFKDQIDNSQNKRAALQKILEKGARVINAERATGTGRLIYETQRKGDNHLEFVQNPDNEVHILNAADDAFNLRETRDHIPQAAKDFLRIYLDVNKDQMNLAKSLGATVHELDDHLSIQSHDRAKIKSPFTSRFQGMQHRLELLKSGMSPFEVSKKIREMARQKWLNVIKPKLNLERTFGELQADGTYKLTMTEAEIDQALHDSYTNIVNGKEKSTTVGPGAFSQERVFHFKDKKSWGEYNALYGKGTLYDAMIDTVMRNGQKIGQLKHFGPTASKSWTEAKNYAIDTSIKTGENLEAKNLNKHNRIFDALVSAKDLPEDTAFDDIYKALKTTSYLSKLGFSNFSSYPDLALQMLRYAKTGENFFTRATWTIKGIADGLPFNKSRDRILKSVAVGMENNQSVYLNRYSDEHNPAIAKIMKLYFTATGQHLFDEGLRSSTTHVFSSYLYKTLGDKFDTLNEDYKNSLSSYGIGEKEHELLSKYKNEMSVWKNHRNVFPEIAENISKKDMEEYAGKTLNDAEYKDLQRHIRSCLTEMYQDHAAYVQLSPTEYDRALAQTSNKNIAPIFRTMNKMFMDFKWFALAQTRKVLGQIYLDNTTQSLGRSIVNASFKQHRLMVEYILTSMAMSWTADSIVSLLKYGHVENPLDHPVKESLRAFMGPLGLLGSIVSTTFTRDKKLSIDSFIGPTGKTLEDTANLFKTLTTYDSHGKRLNYHDKVIRSLLQYTDRHLLPHFWETELLYRHHVFNPLMNRVDHRYLYNQERRFRHENPNATKLPFLENL